jgi:hypothetical protein
MQAARSGLFEATGNCLTPRLEAVAVPANLQDVLEISLE